VATRGALCLFSVIAVWTSDAGASEVHCPAYPAERQEALKSAFQLERATAAALALSGKRADTRPRTAASRNNFIDNEIFSRLEAANIAPAPLSPDTMFLRRVYLDVTGRLPAPEVLREFLADSRANKRHLAIDSLLNSPAYADYWTYYFANRFQITSAYYNLIGIPGRNLFHNFLRDFVQRDRPYYEVASEMISGAGDSFERAPANFVLRSIQMGDPVQDTWDTLTADITQKFLGVQTLCVSCHDGRGHLEQINLHLTGIRRSQFFQQSAFLSRLGLTQLPVDVFDQTRRTLVFDKGHGVYDGTVSAGNPGQRPPRIGNWEPAYLFSGEKPRSGEWRKELARLVIEDRQFARATVNYLWAHFFRQGIVDPPDAWDLARIDPKNPPRAPWTLQASHPELLEALTDAFIASNYSIKGMIRLLVESSAYQLSSRYEGAWRPEYARLFARNTPRRLSAEEAWDALTAATQSEIPMFVEGFASPLLRAVQLPDATEPRQDARIRTFLANFGRGDWWRSPRDEGSSVVQVLYFMNDATVNARTFGARLGGGNAETRVARLAASDLSEDLCIDELFLATVGREPTTEEYAASKRLSGQTREDWLADLQWALLNKVEFLFVN
jgi:Protein of unknown function (DUF1553)/Protein of unknown function (DUF1549)